MVPSRFHLVSLRLRPQHAIDTFRSCRSNFASIPPIGVLPLWRFGCVSATSFFVSLAIEASLCCFMYCFDLPNPASLLNNCEYVGCGCAGDVMLQKSVASGNCDRERLCCNSRSCVISYGKSCLFGMLIIQKGKDNLSLLAAAATNGECCSSRLGSVQGVGTRAVVRW